MSGWSITCRRRSSLFRIDTLIRQGEMEGGAFALRCVGPDAAAVAGDDAMGDREADARALELICIVEALESTEELLRALDRKARAIVAHEIDALAVFVTHADLDHGIFSLARELPGVLEKLGQGLLEERRIALHFGQIGDPQVDRAAGILRFQAGDD